MGIFNYKFQYEVQSKRAYMVCQIQEILAHQNFVDVDALWRLFVLIHPPQMVQA